MCGVWGLGGEGGGRDLVVSIAGTVNWSYYNWIIITFLCTRVEVRFYSYTKDMLLLVTLVTI